jgi:hypothetical protein
MKLMRTGCQVVIFVTVVIVVSIARTPANAQSSCEFSAGTGQSCYYTANEYCDANYVCLILRRIFSLGQVYDEYYYIWPARIGYTQCYAYPYYTGPWIPITSFAACNPQTLY